MGVPKFYRWISERYPCLSEIVKDYQIPEFDNLYLDMNGIIHNCSHPNDNDPHFRISEEQIFKDIFHYIEVLFRMIQPQSVFFMAVDGVAPRAKMNQQRGRRFRSAREAEENEKKAKEKGEVLPTEARFDSNCITPGTEFMARLDAQLQYFITAKISGDSLWQNCTVIYSGHKTPGEGEHKIMEYIRYSKSQLNYDPNTRHCLYGLDADLIMLGLTSHEPHFSLLREEVKFGGKSVKRASVPEETTFHLLHLSLMREYLDYEFYELHNRLSFDFDIEAIIDDWVLMGFLVGNDFIPHLPGLHINKDALPTVYEIYKKVLPLLDGYLNQGGFLNLERFEKFMEHLVEFDVEQFQEINDNMKYVKGKKAAREAEERMMQMVAFDFDEDGANDNTFGCLEDCSLTDEEVVDRLKRLGVEQDFGNALETDESIDEETQFEAEFRQHKRHYYMTKMNLEEVTPQVLKEQVTHYIRGLQWILHYYYNGICSWSWYYPFHYAPFISDIKAFADTDLSFLKGIPFLPFEQLLAVLPPLSVKLLPDPYSRLMLSDNSPIIDYYPKEFTTDLNGKQQDWEAVVLIPFIDETRLLDAMKSCNHVLLPEEESRNTHGPMFIMSYTPKNLGEYKAPRYFPPVGVNYASLSLVWRDEWDIPPSKLIKGRLPGSKHDLYFAGFPTLKHLEHTFRRGKESVKVFQQLSRGENFILEVTVKETPSLENVANRLLGKSIFVSWPHLFEAKVVSLCNSKERLTLSDENKRPIYEELDKSQADYFAMQVSDSKKSALNRWGIDIKETKILVFARPMSGRSYVAGNNGKVTLRKIWSELDQPYPYQTIVEDITVHDPGYKQYKTVEEFYSKDSWLFMLGNPWYGCIGRVIEVNPQHMGRVRVSLVTKEEPDLSRPYYHWVNDSLPRYMSAFDCASRVGISSLLFSRITGTIFMAPPFQNCNESKNRINIGLNLKNNKKNEEVVGFSHKCPETGKWLYSHECVQAIREYQQLFPEVFEYLGINGNHDDMCQDDVFPSTFQQKVPALVKWLHESSFSAALRRKCGSQSLDPEMVTLILEEVSKVSAVKPRPVKIQAKPHLLYKPNALQGCTPPDPTVTFLLFDRIINAREGFSVPLGARGTIIGKPLNQHLSSVSSCCFSLPYAEDEFPLRDAKVASGNAYQVSLCKKIVETDLEDVFQFKVLYRSREFVSKMVRDSPLLTLSKMVLEMALLSRLSLSVENRKEIYILGIQPAENEREKLYDILFDEPFTGGLCFDSPASANRCYRLHWGTMINLSHGLRKLKGRSPPPKKEEIRKRPKGILNADQLASTNATINRNDESRVSRQVVEPAQLLNQLSRKSRPNGRANQSEVQSAFLPPKLSSTSPKVDLDPPKPSQLPQPFTFGKALQNLIQERQRSPDKSSQAKNEHFSKHASPSRVKDPSPVSRQITRVSDVPFILHGNFFANWPSILEKGLKAGTTNVIPCVTYIPPKVGALTYQIHIYLNVEKLLRDNIKLVLKSERQVLCYTQPPGYLHPSYFDRVIDTENMSIIFPIRPVYGGVIPSQSSPQPMNAFDRLSNVGGGEPVGRGRGRGKIDWGQSGGSLTQSLQVYRNIWSNMEDHKRLLFHNGSCSVPQEKPRPLIDPSSIPPEKLRAQIGPTSIPPIMSCPPPQQITNARKEVSVSDLFNFAASDAPKAPSDAPKAASDAPKAASDAPKAASDAPKAASDAPKAPSDAPKAPPLSVAEKPPGQTFIPTQVARKQVTPRKATTIASPPESGASGTPIDEDKSLTKCSKSPAIATVPSTRGPKKKTKYRIAANFVGFS